MAESPQFAFDRDFQLQILALAMQDKRFCHYLTVTAEASYFDVQLITVYQLIRDHFQDYRVLPTIPELVNEAQSRIRQGRIREQDADTVISIATSLSKPVVSSEYVFKEVNQFCARQKLHKALLSIVPMAETPNPEVWGDIKSIVSAACDVGILLEDDDGDFVGEALKLTDSFEDGSYIKSIMPVGIPDLDIIIGGGLYGGQLGIWMGGTGAGKSVALGHCSKYAIVDRKKVLHFSLELNMADVTKRFMSSWFGVPIFEQPKQYVHLRQEISRWMDMYGTNLRIKHFPAGTAGVSHIRATLGSLHAKGFTPDLVVVDYGDLLKPRGTYNDNAYGALGEIFTDLRALADELNIPIWTATQTSRAGINQEINDLDVMGDSFRKAQIADIVIAICATADEAKEGDYRLFVAKNRNGPPKRTVEIRTDYKHMRFYVHGESPYKPKTIDATIEAPRLPEGPVRRRLPKATAPKILPGVTG